MNLKELDNFSLSDAIKFHDQLNPALFNDERMKSEVRHKLLEISEEFVDSLGINQLHIKDIVVSGSNAAYSYTDHSDIDLHIITDMNEFNNNNIYLELFTAKKNLFNDDHNIKIKGYDVEVYVQDSNKPVRTLGEYSVLNNKWTKLPSKRRANFDQSSVELKFTKLIQLSELALRDTNIDKLQNLLTTLRKYRQAGLDEHGEFGPENLAYKALRTHGYVDKLYDHLNDLISKKLSLDEMIAEQREQLVWLKGKLSGSYTDKQLKDMGARLHNGQWVISKARFDTLVRLGQLRESNIQVVKKDVTEGLTSNIIHKLADRKGVKWDNEPSFLKLTKRLTGKEHLDDLNQSELQKVKKYLEKQDMTEGTEQITELRDRMYQYIKSIVPKWPDYVVKDWLYQGFGRYNDENPKRRLLTMLNREGLNRNTQWELVPNMKFTMDNMWTSHTLRKLQGRAGGLSDMGMNVPRDAERHATQSRLAQKQGGVRSEPVILIKRPDGYELLEGWHRTIQHFHKFPDGYTGPAYVAVAQSKQDVAEASGYIPSEAEKNDPRFKTALTVDIHPNTMKQNAKKLGSKISRAGIPPILKPSGKI